jgi:histone H2A
MQSMCGTENKLNVEPKALAVMNSILEDLCDKMSVEAHKVAGYNKRKTVTAADATSGIKMVLHGDLGKNAVTEGESCISTYEKISKLIKTSDLSASKNEKCQLILPVSRVQTMLRSKTHLRVSESSSIYLTAALEHIATEILTLCIRTLKASDIKTVRARHIKMAVENDSEMSILFKNTSFITG